MMMKKQAPIKETIVSDWAHLCDLVFEYRKSGHWLFRGMGHRDHVLMPRIGRPESHKELSEGTSLPYSPRGEQLMIDYFIRAAPPHLNHAPKSRLEWLAVAQHHGMATRLLDWTESLLVAAFFAVKGGMTAKGSPVIYAVKDIPVADPLMHDTLDHLGEVVLYYPAHISPNITAQRSVFSVHLHPDKAFSHPTLERIVLERHSGATAPITYRLNLDACGINYASLMPGIDGLASYMSWLYKWDRLPPGL